MDWEIETLGDPELLVDGDCVVLLDRDGLPDCELDAVAHCVREIVAEIEIVGVRLRSGVLEDVLQDDVDCEADWESDTLADPELVSDGDCVPLREREGDAVVVIDDE